MAFTDSVVFNGKSLRDYLTEITRVSGRSALPVTRRRLNPPLRHGSLDFGSLYADRVILIEGTIEGTDHDNLMSNLDNLKSLFALEDAETPMNLASVSGNGKTGALVFGDETDRYYPAVYDGILDTPDISHAWMTNPVKRVRVRFRCSEPFALSTSLSTVTLSGSAGQFKVVNTGSAPSESIIEIRGPSTNPAIVEGDKVAVAHFDYDDDLTDLKMNTVSGNFTPLFGYRTFKSLTSSQSRAIQIVNKDNLYFPRGAQIDGFNYSNINPWQGTVILWVRPSFDGDDGLDHTIFIVGSGSGNTIKLVKTSGDNLKFTYKGWSAVDQNVSIAVNSSNLAKGTWYFIACRWDNTNYFTGSIYSGVQLDTAVTNSPSGLYPPDGTGANLAIGQDHNLNASEIVDGLIHIQIYERALTDSEISDLRNSGSGVEPFVDPDTKLLLAGENDGSNNPVVIQYPYVDNLIANGNQEDDPISGWSDTSGNVTETRETSTLKYDTASTKVDFTNANDNQNAYMASSALTDGNDYFYRFWLFVSSIDAGSNIYLTIYGNSAVVDNRQLNTGSDDMGVPYSTGKWLYFEGIFQADGSTAHEFRLKVSDAGAGANNSTFYIDQLDCQPSLVTNGGFDTDTDWNKSAPGSSTLTISGGTANFIYGDSTIRLSETLSAITQNTWYTMMYEITAQSGTTGLQLENGNITVNSLILDDSVGKHVVTFKSAATGNYQKIQFRVTGGSFSLENVIVIELDTETADGASVAATPQMESYELANHGQGLKIDGGDTLSYNVEANKDEGAIAVWITPLFGAVYEDSDDPVIVELYYDSNNYIRLFFDMSDEKWLFRKRAAGVDYDAEFPGQTFSAGDSMFLLGLWGSAGVKIFVNGVEGSVSSSNTNALASNPTVLYLSDNNQTLFPDSCIDELVVYSREIDGTGIAKLNSPSTAVVNDNAVLSFTKTLAEGDRIVVDTAKRSAEFVDSSAGTVTNALGDADTTARFFHLDASKSVLRNDVNNDGITVRFRKRWL